MSPPTVERLRSELPRQIAHTKALIRAEAITEGKTVAQARAEADEVHKRVYRRWLREFSEKHPRLETAARTVLKLEGVIDA